MGCERVALTLLPVMKKILGLCALLVVAQNVSVAVGVGDTYSQVIAEKGTPSGKMQAGESQVLHYADATVRLKNGKVTAVETPRAREAAIVPVAATVATTATPKTPAGTAGWTTDYAAAMARAKEENRHVFLFFTGSDWCGWCMRLQKEILTTPEFARFASEKLVLVELDFPRSKPQAAAVKAQNQQLARKFEIRGYPSVIVLDGSGRKVGQLGYQEGGPGPFIQKLNSL